MNEWHRGNEFVTFVTLRENAWHRNGEMNGSSIVSSSPLACSVFLECTSGMGDIVPDTAAGVAIALERGCVKPRVRTRWQWKHRHYDWPSLIASDLFVMDAAEPVNGHHATCTSCTSPRHMHINGGPWPHSFYNTSEQLNRPGAQPDIIVVTFPSLSAPNGSCGAHGHERWMAPLAPTTSPARLRARFVEVLRSVRLLNTSKLPALIEHKAVIHFRRGDMIAHGQSLLGGANRSEALAVFESIDKAVLKWLVASRMPAHVVSDDPIWAAAYLQQLRAAGVQASFRPNATFVDDLNAMRAARVVVRAALTSKFSELACSLSGVPLIVFLSRLCVHCRKFEEKLRSLQPMTSHNASSQRFEVTEGGDLYNTTYIDLEGYLGLAAAIQPNRSHTHRNSQHAAWTVT